MKKSILTIALFVWISTLYGGEIRYPIKNTISINNSNGVSTFSGEAYVGTNVGEPELPVMSKIFLLPGNVDYNSVSISLEDPDFEEFDGGTIFPNSPDHIDGVPFWDGKMNILEGKDMAIYGKNSYFPVENLSFSTGMMRDYKLIEVKIYPFQYNPVAKKIKKLSEGELVIAFDTKAPEGRWSYEVPQYFRNQVASLTENYSQYRNYYDSRMTKNRKGPGYLIITTEALQGTLGSLEYFINSKKARGFTVTVKTESAWGGGSGEAAAVKLREWLQGFYKENNIEYVLFIGHPGTGSVPMISAYPHFAGSYRPYIDYFFSDLSGDWDINKNKKYGEYGAFNSNDMAEGGADKFPEVHVGRIPVYGNPSEADAILKKIVAYEQAKPEAIAWRKSAFLPMNDFNKRRGDGSMFGEAMKKAVFNPAGWPTTTMYGGACSVNGVVSKWNSGQFGMVIWQAHGLYNLAEKVMTTSSASSLSDNYPAHVFNVSCHNAKPENAQNLTYAILKNTGISAMGAGVQVLYSASMGQLGSKGTARHWAYGYAKNMIQGKLASGPAFSKARSELPMKSSTDWLNLIEYTLYGCPAVGVFTSNGGSVAIGTSVNINSMSTFRSFISNKKITIDFDKKVNKNVSVRIVTLNGKTLISKNIDTKAKVVSLDLKDSQLISKGVYVLYVSIDGVSLKQRISVK